MSYLEMLIELQNCHQAYQEMHRFCLKFSLFSFRYNAKNTYLHISISRQGTVSYIMPTGLVGQSCCLHRPMPGYKDPCQATQGLAWLLQNLKDWKQLENRHQPDHGTAPYDVDIERIRKKQSEGKFRFTKTETNGFVKYVGHLWP